MSKDKLPKGWELHVREDLLRSQPPSAPTEEIPLRQRAGFSFMDMAFDLTPDPPRIGPDLFSVSDYADMANTVEPFFHRDAGAIDVSPADAAWLLNHLRASGFRLVRPKSEPSQSFLREALASCELVELPPIGMARGLVQICAHEVIEFPDGGVQFVPWQLKVESRIHPAERFLYPYEADPDEPVYKGRSMIRESRVLGDFLLVAGEGL